MVEFEVSGDHALFSNPVMKLGGEKCSYPVPTYEALKGITMSIYWKPTFVWVIDSVRIMEPIRTETHGTQMVRYNGPKKGSVRDIAFCSYLSNVRYQVRAHFEWNPNHPQFAHDRNEGKHLAVFRQALKKGGRRDIFLGTRECQGFVAPCRFGEGDGYYDNSGEISLGAMYHGITYADEAYSKDTAGYMTVRLFNPVMKNGVITFPRPEKCPAQKRVREMGMKLFKDSREYDAKGTSKEAIAWG